MKGKPTLYEILGVDESAQNEQLQNGYFKRIAALEASRQKMTPQQFSERYDMLRLALSTLTDPAIRPGYDAKLQASRAAARPPQSPMQPRNSALITSSGANSSLRNQADALALRADAMSLRADAMALRTGRTDTRADETPVAVVQAVVGTSLKTMGYLARALGALVFVGVTSFVVTRCGTVSNGVMQNKAAEKVALEEYYRAHGVRPASIAEMEKLEAERHKQENQERAAEQDKKRQEYEEKRFIEEARRQGDQAAREIERAEESAKRQAAWENERKKREQQQQEAAEEARREREKAHWREVLRR